MRDLRGLAERIVAANFDSRQRAYDYIGDGDVEGAEAVVSKEEETRPMNILDHDSLVGQVISAEGMTVSVYVDDEKATLQIGANRPATLTSTREIGELINFLIISRYKITEM